ncbi:MAG: hypothetical protein JRF63_09795, partial [Deltaproteobacteria bacterium]|nr:hypothetical protein [Deltaproteobacteria bacterium]
MNLKGKILIALICVVAVFAGTALFLFHRFMLSNFEAIESEEATRNVDRCYKVIHNEIEHLYALCHDWGSWNDTYEFAVDR